MKILRVLPSMDFGGIERGVYDFSLKASELGHSVVIASGTGRFIPPLMEKGIKWHDLPMDRKTPAAFIKGLAGLREIIAMEQPDVIHVQSRFPCWIAHFAMRRFHTIPWVTSIHNFYKIRCYSTSVCKGDIVITVSNALKNYAEDYFRVYPEKLRVLYNGVDESFSTITREKSEIFHIGMIARLTAWKGHFFFLEAIKKIKEQGFDIKATIVGSGSEKYRSKLQSRIALYRLNGTVKIIKMDSKEALKSFDALVVPSFEPEGFGRTVVEAQMAGVPVIATNIGAIPELIENKKTGFHVNPKDSDSIADRISHLIQNPDMVALIIKKARETALKKFTKDEMVNKTLNIYEELIRNKSTEKKS